MHWQDKDGHYRNTNRVKWWVNTNGNTYNNWLFDCPPKMQDMIINNGLKPFVYPATDPPVFFGHYWMEDKYPVIQAQNIVCLDYSIAKGGSLVAYRWSGEANVNPNNLVSVTDMDIR